MISHFFPFLVNKKHSLERDYTEKKVPTFFTSLSYSLILYLFFVFFPNFGQKKGPKKKRVGTLGAPQDWMDMMKGL